MWNATRAAMTAMHQSSRPNCQIPRNTAVASTQQQVLQSRDHDANSFTTVHHHHLLKHGLRSGASEASPVNTAREHG